MTFCVAHAEGRSVHLVICQHFATGVTSCAVIPVRLKSVFNSTTAFSWPTSQETPRWSSASERDQPGAPEVQAGDLVGREQAVVAGSGRFPPLPGFHGLVGPRHRDPRTGHDILGQTRALATEGHRRMARQRTSRGFVSGRERQRKGGFTLAARVVRIGWIGQVGKLPVWRAPSGRRRSAGIP